jgi:hypothetical protein
VGDEPAQFRSFLVPADEWGAFGEPGCCLSQGCGGRDDSVQVPAVGKALEPASAPIHEVELRTRADVTDDLRYEDLAAPRSGRDPGGSIDRLAIDVIALDGDLAGVDSDANGDLVAG